MILARNIGGSVGISFVTTMLARRAQVHQVMLSQHLSGSNPALQKMLHGMGGGPGGGGLGNQHAWASIQGLVFRQANMLAYIDNFWILGVVIIFMVPLVFLMKKTKPGGTMAVH